LFYFKSITGSQYSDAQDSKYNAVSIRDKSNKIQQNLKDRNW